MNSKILQWNMRSFRSQKPSLQAAIETIKPSIIALQETNLKPKLRSYLSSYHFPPVRKDRIGRDGGGVALFIHHSLQYNVIQLDTPLEVVAALIFFDRTPITIVSMYIPPDYLLSDLHTNLENLIDQLSSPFLIAVDKNANHPSWGSTIANARGNFIGHLIDKRSLIINSK